MGHFYQTTFTGVPEVDAIGFAVDRAGKSYHHTEQWTERDASGRCAADDIDDALRACADTITALREQLAAAPCHRADRAERILAALREPSEGMQKAAMDEYWCPVRGGRKVWIRVIRAAVAAAEQEAQGE